MTDKTAVAAVIPAAGSGTRLAADEETEGPPKALRPLGSSTLIRYAVGSLEHAVDQVVVATSAGLVERVTAALDAVRVPVRVVVGGSTRRASVEQALAVVDPATRFVLVHDAARPLVPPAVTDRLLAALRAGADAVVPTVPVADTLREVVDGASRTVDRSRMRAVQTPQAFVLDVLRRAHAADDVDDATDDAGMVERLGLEVRLVDGDPLGFKITQALDLRLAEAVVAARSIGADQR